MSRIAVRLLTFSLIGLAPLAAWASCGRHAGQAEADLFDRTTKMAVARADKGTVITLANDNVGDVANFAVVVPVPASLNKSEVGVRVRGDNVIEAIDAYTAPRLVESRDENPCIVGVPEPERGTGKHALRLWQTSEAQRLSLEWNGSVGVYEITMVSAHDGEQPERFLQERGYQIPGPTQDVLDAYIEQGMHFVIATVDTEAFRDRAAEMLRPLQIAFESDQFRLPLHLGRPGGKGLQDLFLFALTRNGRFAASNYRTARVPTEKAIPLYIKDRFEAFYRAMFGRQARARGMGAAFVEYAGQVGDFDPCVTPAAPVAKLHELGAWWLERTQRPDAQRDSGPPDSKPVAGRQTEPVGVYLTRLHMRYSAASFPKAIRFQETDKTEDFQGVYYVSRPYTGSLEKCQRAGPSRIVSRYYRQRLPRQFREYAETLSRLTGWDRDAIEKRMAQTGQPLTNTREKLIDGDEGSQKSE